MIPDYLPVIIKYESNDNNILIKTILDLIKRKNPKQITTINNIIEEIYDFEDSNLKLWSDNNFTKLLCIKRKIGNNKLYRITTDNGIVDVDKNQIILEERVDDENRTYIEEKSVLELRKGNVIVHCRAPSQSSNDTITDYKFKYDTQLETAKALNYFQNNRLLNFYYYIEYKNDNYCIKVPVNNSYRKNNIISIEELGIVDNVYDIITENTRFAAGVGNIIL